MKRINIKKIVFSCFSVLLCNIGTNQSLFTLLKPNQTGIHFNNKLTDEKDHNILLYSNYYGGAGVGVADFNRDGFQDIFFAGNLVNDELYYNKGNFIFENVTESAGITNPAGWSTSVVVADINNDQWPDIYVTRELHDDDPNLRKNLLYLNNGDGTFREMAEEVGLDNSERTRHAVFFDYDADGLLDVFLLNQPPNPGNFSAFAGTELMREEWAPRLYKQASPLKFIDVSLQANVHKPCYPNSVSAGDFNDDGWTDLYISNDYDSPDFYYRNNGDGTFTNIIDETHKHISYYSMGVDAADINNDAQLDIMTLDMVAEDNFRLKSNMSGMNPQQFWTLLERGGHRQYMFNSLHLAQGKDHYSDISQLAGVASTDWSWSNLIADFDNDGWKDIHVTNGLLRDIRNTDAGKTFPEYIRKVSADYVRAHPNEGDIDLFEILDLDEALSLIPSVPLKNYFFLNNGDLTFRKASEESGVDQAGFSNGSAYADFDNDGDLDLVVNNINKKAFVYRNNSNNNFLRVSLSRNGLPIYGSKVEISTDLGTQLYEFTNVRGMYSTSENIAHFGLGSSSAVEKMKITWPDGRVSEYENIDINKIHEIAYDAATTALSRTEPEEFFMAFSDSIGIHFRHQENDFDDYAKQVLLPHKMSQFGPAMTHGDVNGDGLEDLFFGGAVGQAGVLYVQQSDGQFLKSSFQQGFKNDSLYEDLDAVFLDFDLDGDQDLYVVSGGNEFPPYNKYYQDRIYVNDGAGKLTRSEKVLPAFRESGSVVRVADYDADGDPDLFVGGRLNPWDYPAPSISRLLRNDSGIFVDVTKENASDLINIGLVTDASWSDADDDGDLDLQLVGEWMTPTFLLNNNQKFSISEPVIPEFQGWLYSIVAEDIDQDGDQDYLIGNLGLNYKYKASQEEPFEVFYDDFDDNGSKDIVLSYYNYGEQYPLRGRSCSAEQIPELKKKFESYDLFASVNLDQVYGKEALEEAYKAKATDFRSGLLLNHGDLKFEFIAFPNEAQVSSINDFVVLDINQDGHLDFISCGNLYTSEIETTRNDAGIGNVMLGDGKGHFKHIDSGLLLDKDAKHLILLATQQGKLLISANNDDRPSVFRLVR